MTHALPLRQTGVTHAIPKSGPQQVQVAIGQNVHQETGPCLLRNKGLETQTQKEAQVTDAYDDRLEHAKFLFRMAEDIDEMERTEGFAYSEDTYTARIPGKTLRKWHDTLQKAYFKLNKD